MPQMKKKRRGYKACVGDQRSTSGDDFIVGRDAMVWPMVPAGVSNDAVQYARDARPVWDGDE